MGEKKGKGEGSKCPDIGRRKRPKTEKDKGEGGDERKKTISLSKISRARPG